MKCKSCGLRGAYIRLKTKDSVCRNCGNIEKLKTEKEEKIEKTFPEK